MQKSNKIGLKVRVTTSGKELWKAKEDLKWIIDFGLMSSYRRDLWELGVTLLIIFFLSFSYLWKIPEMVVINQVSTGEYELPLLHDSTEAHGSFCSCLPVGDDSFFIGVKGKNGCWMAEGPLGWLSFILPHLLMNFLFLGPFLCPGRLTLLDYIPQGPFLFVFGQWNTLTEQFIFSLFHHWFWLCFIGSNCQ